MGINSPGVVKWLQPKEPKKPYRLVAAQKWWQSTEKITDNEHKSNTQQAAVFQLQVNSDIACGKQVDSNCLWQTSIFLHC